jgi:purine-binding chemotaxis protein CheW
MTGDGERMMAVDQNTTDAVEQGASTSALPEPVRISQVIAFHLGEQRYALPIERVQEIQQLVAFSEMPASDDSVVGMINLRGRVIPALDLRLLVGLEAVEYGLKTPMIICRVDDAAVALLVDEVEDVLTLSEDRVSAPPKMHQLASRMLGVGHIGTELVFVLDVDRLIDPANLPGIGGDE